MKRHRGIAVGLAVTVAVLDLIGWATGTWLLTQFDADWPRMTPWTAILLLALVGAFLLQTVRPSPVRTATGRAVAFTVAALEALFLLEHAIGVSLGVDRWWFPDAVSAAYGSQPGRPLAHTAFSMLALALAVAFVRLERRWVATAWPAVLAAAAVLPIVALSTFLFNEAEMLDAAAPIEVNGATAAAILLMVYATGAERPDRRPVAWILERQDRRKLAQLVITFALVPVMVALCRLTVLRLGLRGDTVWAVSIGLTTLVLGAYSFREVRRLQRLTEDRMRQARARADAERERAQAVERFRILADNTVDVVVHLRGNEPAWVSPSIEPAFGWPAAQWLGADFSPRIHPEDLGAVIDALAEVAGGQSALARFRVATADGDYRWTEGRGQPYADVDGNTDGVIVAVRLIDEQVAVEKELAEARDAAVALSEAKSDYVATVSHEIRSPLNAVLGFAELLERQLATAGRNEAAEWSRRIRSEAERMTRLLGDLLDLARLDAGRTTVASEPFRLRELVDDVIEISRMKAEAKGLHLHHSVDPALADWRRGDADKLHQVLRNLVTNAQKFTVRGGVEVEVSLVAAHDRSDLIRFAVTDTGPGIPGADIERILEPFAQVRASDAERGSGLGLAISNRLVMAMGGDGIHIASLEGHGSTFHFTVPLPESSPDERRPEESAQPDRIRSGRTVLVVDDNETNQLLIQTQLRKLGYDCVITSNGAEALEQIESRRFDVVLMDCSMPVMDGYEATRRIRARERRTGGRLPVLALTASASGSNRAACERAGMDGFLGKPIHLSHLARELGRYVSPKRTALLDDAAASPPTASTTVLDHTRLQRLRDELGDAPLRKVVATFVVEVPRRLTELYQVAEKGDADAVRRCAHAVRSPSTMLGATALTEQLAVIEESADPVREVSQHDLDALVDDTLEQVQTALDRMSGPDRGGM